MGVLNVSIHTTLNSGTDRQSTRASIQVVLPSPAQGFQDADCHGQGDAVAEHVPRLCWSRRSRRSMESVEWGYVSCGRGSEKSVLLRLCRRRTFDSLCTKL